MDSKKVFCAFLALALAAVLSPGAEAHEQTVPIRIDCNADFAGYASSGNGTEANPWIIEGLEINGTGYGYCIYIGNTTDHFALRANSFHHAFTESPDNQYFPNAGIALCNVRNATVTGNEVHLNCWLGIYLYSSSGNLITGNNVTHNEEGIYLIDDSDGNEVTYNYAGYNTCGGITTDNSLGNVISYNTADYNGMGVHVNDASDTLVAQNLMFYNDYGLYFEDSPGNEARNNSICLSYECGLYLDESSYCNLIYHNNFGNNALQAYDDSWNAWTDGYPDGGNFWTDYNGTDECSGEGQDEPGPDGIGDTPYTILGGGYADTYPMMESINTYGLGIRDEPNAGLGIRDEPN